MNGKEREALWSTRWDETTVRAQFLRWSEYLGRTVACAPLVLDLDQLRNMIRGGMLIEHHLAIELGVAPIWPGTAAECDALARSQLEKKL